MVGHTGDIEATVVACKAADEAVKVCCRFSQSLLRILVFLSFGMQRFTFLYPSPLRVANFCACTNLFQHFFLFAHFDRVLVADDPRCS